MTDRSKTWLDTATDDLASASAMEPVNRATSAYLYQQAAEKALKALCLKVGEPVERTHNIAALWVKLSDMGAVEGATSEQVNDMKRLTALNIEARYPVHDETMTPAQWIDEVDLARARKTSTWIVNVVRALIMEPPRDPSLPEP